MDAYHLKYEKDLMGGVYERKVLPGFLLDQSRTGRQLLCTSFKDIAWFPNMRILQYCMVVNVHITSFVKYLV